MRRLSSTITVLIATVTLLAGCSVIERFDPSMTTVGPAGRVEMAEAGFALTFPDDWRVEARPSGSDALPSMDEPELDALLTPILSAVPPSMHDRCLVVDLAPFVEARSDWSTLEDVVAGYRGLVEADPRWVGVRSAIIELPAGPSGRILRTRDGESESVSSYVFVQEDAWFLLECVAHQVPAEDWHSIARTFEFLSREE